jgi:hypothetical protein
VYVSVSVLTIPGAGGVVTLTALNDTGAVIMTVSVNGGGTLIVSGVSPDSGPPGSNGAGCAALGLPTRSIASVLMHYGMHTLNAYLVGANGALTFTLPVTTSGWAHAWFDASAWTEPTATLKIDFAVGGVGREARVILDEITWGSAITGPHPVFLPLVSR